MAHNNNKLTADEKCKLIAEHAEDSARGANAAIVYLVALVLLGCLLYAGSDLVKTIFDSIGGLINAMLSIFTQAKDNKVVLLLALVVVGVIVSLKFKAETEQNKADFFK